MNTESILMLIFTLTSIISLNEHKCIIDPQMQKEVKNKAIYLLAVRTCILMKHGSNEEYMTECGNHTSV